MRTTGDKRLDKALNRTRKVLRGLQGTEGRVIARRNARKRALMALRGVRATLDELYPAIIVRTGVVRLKTREGREDRLKRAGWRFVVDRAATEYAAAGVPIRKVEEDFWVPGWAIAIGLKNKSELRAAKHSRKLQHAALTAEALSGPL